NSFPCRPRVSRLQNRCQEIGGRVSEWAGAHLAERKCVLRRESGLIPTGVKSAWHFERQLPRFLMLRWLRRVFDLVGRWRAHRNYHRSCAPIPPTGRPEMNLQSKRERWVLEPPEKWRVPRRCPAAIRLVVASISPKVKSSHYCR